MTTYSTHEEAVKNNPDFDIILKCQILGSTYFEASYSHEDGLYDHENIDDNNPYGGLFVMMSRINPGESFWTISKQDKGKKSMALEFQENGIREDNDVIKAGGRGSNKIPKFISKD
jgi:hypothetical protein